MAGRGGGAKIQGLERLLARLRQLAERVAADAKVRVTVGYTASYAMYIHENLEMPHRVGQAKYLEQPAREMRDQLRTVIRDQVRAGRSLGDALMVAGLTLQAASQRLVPVDTGALRASAFTRKTTGG